MAKNRRKIVIFSLLIGILYAIIICLMISYDFRISFGDVKLRYGWNMVLFIPMQLVLAYIFTPEKRVNNMLKPLLISIIFTGISFYITMAIVVLFY